MKKSTERLLKAFIKWDEQRPNARSDSDNLLIALAKELQSSNAEILELRKSLNHLRVLQY